MAHDVHDMLEAARQRIQELEDEIIRWKAKYQTTSYALDYLNMERRHKTRAKLKRMYIRHVQFHGSGGKGFVGCSPDHPDAELWERVDVIPAAPIDTARGSDER